MRRKEFLIKDYEELELLANHSEVGYLGFSDPEGYSRVVPLDFLLKNYNIYFTGPLKGRNLKPWNPILK